MDIKALLAEMTVEEKIGQMMQFNSNVFVDSKADITGPLAKMGIQEEALKYVGSTLNFQGAAEMKEIQDRHMAEDPHKIPMLFMMDVIHGFRTIFPIPLGLGCSFDPELVQECSRMAAKEAAAGGVQVTFTPMVDYVRDARWGRVMESCGEDPYLNGVMGAAQIKAFQGEDLSDHESLATCIKHFAAYGGAEAGRDYNTVEISERLLRECYLPAYKACIDAGAAMLMPSFNSLNGVPSTVNPWLMQQILRKEWDFKGVVITDYNAIGELRKHGITDNMKDAARLAFENGNDIEMISTAYGQFLKELIEEGVFTEAQLDESVYKVLKLKDDLGMFEDPYHGASAEKEAQVCLTPEHRAIARKAAEESAVLLKNEGILPFSEDVKKIALIGPFADEKAIKGFWACCGEDQDCVTVKEGIAALLPGAEITVAKGCGAQWNDLDTAGFAEAVEAAKNAEIVVLCLGEPQNYSGEGNSRADIGLPGVQNELAKAVLAVNQNAAVVLFNGRPLVLTELEKAAPAILDLWFPGTEGGAAAANLLFGKANPCGKVTMSFPKALGQCPIYYNHPMTGRPKSKSKPEEVHQGYASNYIGCGNLPLFPFGHGLSYTTFTYESMTLDKTEMTAADTITVSVTVANTGNRAGKETVQLYMHDLYASAVRPIQQLIAFEKISLAPGEKKTVTFEITEPMLRFWTLDNRHISEPGEFELFVGHADHPAITQHFWLK